ncbi:MAG: phage terminase large subunit [Pirellulales bacterium]|nr:phage terminase large subunit [Pirellulales bacterium]
MSLFWPPHSDRAVDLDDLERCYPTWGAFVKATVARLARRRAEHDEVGDLLAWGHRYLPHHFQLPPSSLHLWLAGELERRLFDRGWKLNVIGPRGAAKSTLASLAYPLRMALEGRESYIWIVSDTRQQAHLHLENVKAELVDNRRLAAAYPQAAGRGSMWRAGAVRLPNGVAIEAFGTGQRLRGRRYRDTRPSLIVCDDLQGDRHIESAHARELARRWFHGALVPAGGQRTNFLHLATALHPEALALDLLKNPGWTSQVFRAIEHWPDELALWEQWEQIYTNCELADPRAAARAFYLDHQARLHAGSLLLWPEQEDLYALMAQRAESGRAPFEREKQSNPWPAERAEWPAEYFSDAIWFDRWPFAPLVRALAIDPSQGRDAHRGDYAALVFIALDPSGVYFVEAELRRFPIVELVATAAELYQHHQPDVLGIEANQFQELIGDLLIGELRRRGLAHVQPMLVHNNLNKRVRIRRLGPLLAARRLRFKSNSPATRLLVDQMRQFPVGDHDDGPDALEMAIRLAATLLRGRATDDGLGDRLPIDIR